MGQGWVVRPLAGRAAHLVPAPPPGGPTPDEWGDPDEAVRRLAATGLDATVEERPFAFRFASPREALDVFTSAAGPFVQLMEIAAAVGHADEARQELLAALTESNAATDDSCVLPAPYLLALARR